jgi:pyruvate/2-oxoglutarate/acetoin dehydrogenase E1 component
MTYYNELCRAMEAVAEHPRAIFLGQAVAEKGTGMTASFANVSPEKLLELPVFEETQLGMSIGLALDGALPVSVYPRWNFLVCAANQLVNHLDKLPLYSTITLRVIIRVASATPVPLDPGPQHLGDFTDAFRLMLKTVKIVPLVDARRIVPEYRQAMIAERSTILVEYPGRYHDSV